MKVRELARLLDGHDPEAEVAVRVSIGGELKVEDQWDLDGEYLDVVDDRSVLAESGRVVIIADLLEA